jgi:hypothetical protein
LFSFSKTVKNGQKMQSFGDNKDGGGSTKPNKEF